ncbi:DUF4143 domain-containing protein [Promicromonospora sp. NPDC019610]|uniref:DUF4143 domain-containing protein n=1 Tax=Promicromonospora sp. NPDC019610 TaxID=3364405 RepID=UPI00378D1BCA
MRRVRQNDHDPCGKTTRRAAARRRPVSRTRAELFHYRTRDQVEVDIVLENRRGEVIAIEVKSSATPSTKDFRGIRHLHERGGCRPCCRLRPPRGTAHAAVR